jgi:pantetheine-phosphate adenylyltransferase
MEINNKRVLKGKKPLKILKISFVLAEDGKPISSTRINRKEIDENGNLLYKD